MREAIHTMAKLGGFIGRKSDGEPGMKTLWRGYHARQLVLLGMDLTSPKHFTAHYCAFVPSRQRRPFTLHKMPLFFHFIPGIDPKIIE
ncbi:MAG: IS4 family transposase [Firmicutes bacterium]|nr:IS4 family transposase [Bacillota bacterium]